jgi:hypothetical protein
VDEPPANLRKPWIFRCRLRYNDLSRRVLYTAVFYTWRTSTELEPTEVDGMPFKDKPVVKIMLRYLQKGDQVRIL